MAKPWSREWKEEQLALLYDQWKDCEACPLHASRTNVVFGMGNPDAKLLLVGEGPGEEEDATGEPFCGVSGQLLRGLMNNTKILWKDVYVTNIVGCRPVDDGGKNREPSVKERDACISRVHQIIYIVDPWIVMPVGKAALKALAKGRDWAITDSRGQVFSSPHQSAKVTGDKNGLEVTGHMFPRNDLEHKKVHLEYDMVPILHPSYLLREDSYDAETKKFQPDGLTQKTFEDLKRVKRFLTSLEEAYASIPKFDRS
jgi:DNA polymerase